MKRNRSEAKKEKGFYIAACCCVLVVAIVGYVSWFLGRPEPSPKDNTNFSYHESRDIPNLSELSKTPIKEEVKTPEQRVISVPEKTLPVAKNVISEDNVPDFIKPVDGKIIGEFSGETLIFSEALSDWRSHDGVDIEAKAGEKVVASADGVVVEAYSGSLGNSIVIDHENGYKTLYANLADFEGDLIGQNVKRGDKIAEIGKSAIADLTDKEHLHFEVIMDDKPIDPTEYIK